MKRFILQGFYSIFSGFMLAMAISNEVLPFGSAFIALFCLIPMYWAFYNSQSYGESALVFALQILTTHLISSFWLANFHGYAVFTLGASAFGTAFEGALCGVIAYMYPARHKKNFLQELSSASSKYINRRVLWFTASWVFYEWIKSVWDMGYPWGTVSMATYNWRVMTQIADVTGVWGVTVMMTLINSYFAEYLIYIRRSANSMDRRTFKENLAPSRNMVMAFFAVCFVYGCFQLFTPITPTKHLNIVMVQQNSDPWEGGEVLGIEISERLTEEKVKEMRENGLEPDIVLWSEGVLGRSFPASRSYYENNPGEEGLGNFIKRMGVPFIIGGQVNVNPYKRHTSNAAIFFDKKGTYSGFYSKIHLVPFAEVIPYNENPLMKAFMKNVVRFSSSGWTPGKQYVVFRVPLSSSKNRKPPLEYALTPEAGIFLDQNGLSNSKDTQRYISNDNENPDNFVYFTTPICFEDAFNDVCRRLYNMGSEVFLNITNDSWSLKASSEYQHFIAASYRAIEYRTTLVRCTNSGYSVVVDPKGEILADLPLFTEAALGYSVPVYARKNTIYARCGDWFIYIIVAFIALYAFYAFIKNLNFSI